MTDPRLGKVCDLAGISRATERLATFQQLKKGIDLALADVDKSRKRAELLNSLIALTKFTRATCDAFISMAAALSGRKADIVKTGYSSISVVVDAAVRHSLGQEVSYVDVGEDFAQEATGFIPDKFGPAKFLTQGTIYKAQIITGAVKQDKQRVVDKSVDYGVEMAKYSLDVLKEDASSNLGKSGAGAAKAYVELSKATFSYNEALEKIFDDLLADRESTASQYTSQKVMLLRLARGLQAKIDEVQGLLTSCGIELA
ncbi:MAG: hypothetical protein ACJ798_08915 [Phenylobacterium sp.]